MADRIAVLFEGELHQLGTPSEIMNTPATAKVAGFVGDPTMNILTVKIFSKNGQLWFEGDDFELQVPAHLKASVEKGQYGELLLGIRPGDIVFSQTELPSPAFATKLYIVEALHRKSILNVEKNESLIKVNASTDFEGKIGDPIWLDFPTDKLFIFDPETSLRITD